MRLRRKVVACLQLNLGVRQLKGGEMRRFLVPVFAAACLCGAIRMDGQQLAERPNRLLPLRPFFPSAQVSASLRTAPANSAQISRSNSVWRGFVIGAGTSAVVGALWGKHVDGQQVCPAAGPCGGRSNAGPYALSGAAVGAALGAAIGWFAGR
jgi:hypothetical protein